MKVGIFGGTFDPIHNSHINISLKAGKQFGLDEVWLMPSPNPPHKDVKSITDWKVRYDLVKLAIEDYPILKACDYEYKNHLQYTADTISSLKKEYPDYEFYLIIGSDSLINIESWYHPEIIFDNSHILVAKRADSSGDKLNKKVVTLEEKYQIKICVIDIIATNISSTNVRMNVKEYGDGIPQKVASFISDSNIYCDIKMTARMNPDEILSDLKLILNSYRYQHTIGVAATAKAMAEKFNVNPNKAYLAGILHDCAKCIKDNEAIKICIDNNIDISNTEKINKFLLHAKVGAFFAKEKYGINDEEILSAIRWHTTGKPAMTELEKIIFSADYIEPSRCESRIPNLSHIREIAYIDIDLTVYTILKNTLDYLRNSGKNNIDKNTEKAFKYYKKIIEDRG